MKILFPTDFSENANLALNTAIDIVEKTKGTLYVLNAYDLPYSDRSMTVSLMDVMRENSEKNMALLEDVLSEKGISSKTHIELGNPIRMIKNISEKEGIDMIIMGTKGASGIEEVLIGSNAAATIQNTTVPVMVIPPDFKIHNPFQKIVLATDMSFQDIAPLLELKQFARLFNSEIKFLYVSDNKIEIDEEARKYLDEEFKDIMHHYSVITGANIEKEILAKAENGHADLICAIHRHYGFFEGLFHKSITAKLAYHSSIPILALHEKR